MGLNHFSDMTAKLPTFKNKKCWQFFYFKFRLFYEVNALKRL
jgi:hypothetical protein